ncbi:MAG: Ig-like domain-containing protein [Bacteroidota bacterium]
MKLRFLLLAGFIIFVSPSYSQENPPEIEFVYPGKNQQISSDTLTLLAIAKDPDEDILKLEFLANDSVIAVLFEEPFQYFWDSIPGGYYHLKAKVYDSYGYIRFDETQVAVGDSFEWRPYTGVPHKVPGRIEAEHFDNGGEGVAYNENDNVRKGCTGSLCRPYELVDIGASVDDIEPGMYYNYIVSHTYPGNEWLDYTISVDSSAWFIIRSRIATSRDDRTFHFELDGIRVTDSILATNTLVYNKNEWYNFKNIYSDSIYIEKGLHILKLYIHDMQTGQAGGINFNYFDLIYPDQNPPKIHFLSPVSAETVKQEGSDIVFDIFAEDSESEVERVEFFKNGEIYEILYNPPWKFEVKYDTPDGYVVHAEAFDTDGNSEVSLKKKITFIPVNTSIKDDHDETLHIFPNPAGDVIHLNAGNINIDNIEIYNFQGKLLTWEKDIDASIFSMNISQLESGMYFLILSRDTGRDVFRFVKK